MHTLNLFRRAICAAALAAAALSAQTGYIKTEVKPGRAGVFIDGKYVGPAANFGMSRKYAVPAGTHQIKLVDPRYEEASASVTVEAGKTATVTQVLKVKPEAKGPFGSLRTVHPDKYAAVYINDQFVGHAGEFNNSMQVLKLPAGDYDVRIEPVGGGTPVHQKVKIEVDKTVIVK
jgi:hypothetical protein